MNTEALRPGDPVVVGPFRVQARLAEHQAGLVLLAHDQAGQPAAVAILHAAAAGDSAVRDRLAGALEDVADPEQVVASGVNDPVPWVATVYEKGRPDHALTLLDAAALASGVSPLGAGSQAGPDFAPHWAGSPGERSYLPPSPPPQASARPAPANTQRSLLVLGAVIFGAIVLIIGVWWLISTFGGGDELTADPAESHQTVGPLPTSEPSPTDPSDPSDPSTTGPTTSAEPSPTVADGPPGPVAGPTYGKNEKTYLMELKGMPFSFRTPGTWGCMKGSIKDRPDVLAWICADERGAWDDDERPEIPGRAEIYVQNCPAPCGAAQWKNLRGDAFALDEKLWKTTDSTTRYAEQSIESGRKLRLSMSHVFASKPGGKPDRHVGVKVEGAPADKKTMQKLINELRTKSG